MIGKAASHRIITAMILALTVLKFASSTVTAAGPGVHGRVIGHDEDGTLQGIVAGARIQFETSSGTRLAETTSDGNGYYKVDLPAGEYFYRIEAEGYRTEDRGRGMRLSQSQGYALFNLALTRGTDDPNRKPPEVPVIQSGKLAGHVFERTPEGLVGIPDATVSLRHEGTTKLSTARSRATQNDKRNVGDYEVTLRAGTYRASAVAAGFDPFVDPKPVEIASEKETKRDFILTRSQPADSGGQGIRGVVTVIDSGSSPPPVRIRFVKLGQTDRPAVDTLARNSGAFERPLPPGRYRVTASADGYPAATSPPIYVLDDRFAVANLTLRARRVPEPGTTLEAFVFTKSPSGREPVPLAGARVSLLKVAAAAESATEGTSDSTGHALFALTEAGEFKASAFLKGYLPGTGSGVIELGKNHQIAIELVKESAPPPAELALDLHVGDLQTKLPLAGASILARHDGESVAEAARGTTDGQGALRLMVLRSGNYTVLAQKPGYEPAAIKTSVSSGGENKAVIDMKRIGPERQPGGVPEQPVPPRDVSGDKLRTVAGFVAYREPMGQLRSIANAKLTWERTVPRSPHASDVATTDGSGRFRVDIPLGTYQVRIAPPTGFEGLLEQVQILPETSEKYFIVRRTEATPPAVVDQVPFEGTVVSADGFGRLTGVAGGEVLFTDARGAEKIDTDRVGHFAERLPAGGYRVQVRAPGFEPLDTRVEVRAGMSALRFVLKRIPPPPTSFHLRLSVVERGARGGSMRAVADAKVHVTLGAQPAASGVSDPGGQYSATLNPGTYAVRVDKPGYEAATSRVVVSNRDVMEQVVLTRRDEPGADQIGKARLTVHVTRRATRTQAIGPISTPVAGAHVVVMLGAKPLTTGVTNAAGIFATSLPPGNYSVKVDAQGFAPAGKTVSVSSQDSRLDFQLSPLQAATGEASPSDRIRQLPKDDFGRMRQQPDEPSDARYVVEYRMKGQTNWKLLATKGSQREANSALVLALERKQIPASAETRIRVEKGLGLRTRIP